MPLFDRYLFADYSGAGEDHTPQGDICVYEAVGSSTPTRVTPASLGLSSLKRFSRNTLRKGIRKYLNDAHDVGERVIFGMDHQYGWPRHLRGLAGLAEYPWRQGLAHLNAGAVALPPLDIPSRYCTLFNSKVGVDAFWSSIFQMCASYGIPNIRPDIPIIDEFRLTELVSSYCGGKPSPANKIGGASSVAGQTVCGLKQLAQMTHWSDVTWWPFDGLDIDSDAYKGKHVAVEVYPSLYTPLSSKFKDGQALDSDVQAENTQKTANMSIHCFHALCSTRFVQKADQTNALTSVLDLSGASPTEQTQIMAEGWIIGVMSCDLLRFNLCN